MNKDQRVGKLLMLSLLVCMILIQAPDTEGIPARPNVKNQEVKGQLKAATVSVSFEAGHTGSTVFLR